MMPNVWKAGLGAAMAMGLAASLLGCGAAQAAVTFTFTTSNLSWIAPATGLYQITASGGSGGAAGNGVSGGLGDQIGASFMLTKGQELAIGVGYNGLDGTGVFGGEGGAPSFVLGHITDAPIAANWYPLLVAGGGGGAGTGLVDGLPVGGSFISGGNAGLVAGAGASGLGGHPPGGAAGSGSFDGGIALGSNGADAPESGGGLGGGGLTLLSLENDPLLDPFEFPSPASDLLGGSGGSGWNGGGGGAPGLGGGGGGSFFTAGNRFFPGSSLSEGNTLRPPEVEITFAGSLPSTPEPSTWSMLILGFGAAGLALRHWGRRGEAMRRPFARGAARL